MSNHLLNIPLVPFTCTKTPCGSVGVSHSFPVVVVVEVVVVEVEVVLVVVVVGGKV